MFSTLAQCKQECVENLRTEAIRPNPYQPRREMERDRLDELSRSIAQYGLMQPIVVRQINSGEYELIAGERRLRACKNLGLREIPAVVMNADRTDSAILALIENIQRENLGYIEEAEAFSALIGEHGLTQDELAEKLGKSQSTIANKIRILKLSPELRQKLSENNLTERHARALLRLPDDKNRNKILNAIIGRGLNVAKSEELIENELQRLSKDTTSAKPKNIRVFKDIRIFSNTIKQAVDMMRQAGIGAKSEKNETNEYIEYIIKIPKESGCK